jgi:hypothetical protein
MGILPVEMAYSMIAGYGVICVGVSINLDPSLGGLRRGHREQRVQSHL